MSKSRLSGPHRSAKFYVRLPETRSGAQLFEFIGVDPYRESIASSEAIRRIVTVHVTEAGSATIAPIVAATALCVRSGRAMCEPV
jgi:hypothetical protein